MNLLPDLFFESSIIYKAEVVLLIKGLKVGLEVVFPSIPQHGLDFLLARLAKDGEEDVSLVECSVDLHVSIEPLRDKCLDVVGWQVNRHILNYENKALAVGG